jgi:FMN reductase
MTGDFESFADLNDHPARDGVAPDRSASALHLCHNGVGVPREESVLER